MDVGHLAWLLVMLVGKGLFYLLLWTAVWLAGSILVVKFGLRQISKGRQKFARADLNDIDRMSGNQFEEYLEVLFERLGYKTIPTERFDKGADLILVKGGIRTAVQAKCWAHKRVDVEAVRAVVAAMRPYKCTRGIVVTNSYFTRPAVQAAKDNNIELWNRDNLTNVLLAVNNPGQPLPIPGPIAWLFNDPCDAILNSIPSIMPESNYTCTTCSKQVTKGIQQYCLDQPHRFGGKVYCMDHQRQATALHEEITNIPSLATTSAAD